MKASVFIGTSVDGFIARLDGSFDFLPEGGGEPHGYDEFMASVDALVIGRNTYETVLAFPQWPYGDKPVSCSAAGPSIYRLPVAESSSRWEGNRRKLFLHLKHAGSTIFTSMEELRSKDSSVPG